jgi:hypothetical protein
VDLLALDERQATVRFLAIDGQSTMSEPQWKPVLTRGNFAFEIFTPRAFAEIAPDLVPEGKWSFFECRNQRFDYMTRYTPDGEAPTFMLMRDAQSVREFIRDMEPHAVQVKVAEGEDQFAVEATLRGEVH